MLFLLWLSCVAADSGTLFKRTTDIADTTFKSYIKHSSKARSVLDCAHKCQRLEKEEGLCNAYSFISNDCDLAKLTYLEDPQPRYEEREILVDLSARKNMVMYCRGGTHCCTADNLCADGEGDCNNDQGCQGVSICGQNNCATKSGGRWDGDDDCCERRCTSEHPCVEGEGQCEYDTDCKNSGWSQCGNDLCLSTTYFPTADYPNNTETFGFTGSHNCCHRKCNKLFRICGNNEVGCSHDDDCSAGIHCNTDITQPTCLDTDECDITNIKMNGTGYCGVFATCSNTVGSFTCTCITGYVSHTPWVGCREKDECTEGGHNCKANTNCTNTPGSWECTCKVGFTGNPTSGCTDIDECSYSDLNTCSGGMYPHGVDVDLFGLDDGKTFYVGPGDDGYSHSFRFEVKGLRGARILFCQGTAIENCYQVIFGNSRSKIYKGDEKIHDVPLESTMKLSTTEYKAFIVSLVHDGAANKLTIEVQSAYEENVFTSWTDTSDIYAVDQVILKGPGEKSESIYVRNFRKNKPLSMCLNNVGSFVCIPTDEEYVAVGFGGHTTSGSTYPSQVSVVTNKEMSCTNHNLPNLSGRYSPGVQAIGKWLFVCGGHYYGAKEPQADCKKLDMNAESPSWQNFVNLPVKRRDFSLVRYDDYMYAVAGYEYWDGGSQCRNDVYRIKADGGSWESRSSYPINIHRHCGVADHGADRIYIIGGHDCGGGRQEVYYYTISSNTWTHHSNLPWGGAYDCACGVITQKDEERWLVVNKGNTNGAVIYWNLDKNTGWTHTTNLYGNYKQGWMSMVTLTPYSALMLGGWSQRNGNSLRNFWTYNSESQNFEDGIHYLTNEHKSGQWTAVKKGYRALQNCASEKAYAAVGWGGHTTNGAEYPSEWSVLLRKRRTKGDPRNPVRCDTALPNLSGRYWPGVTAVGYRLMVCGGFPSGQSVTTYGKQCFYLDTNTTETPAWNAMTDMPVHRAYFEFETYGDAAYAIAGYGSGEHNRVDRWSATTGWTQMASYPHNNHRFCAVADEGNDRIYSLGGVTTAYRDRAYYYTVSTNKWTSFRSLKYDSYDSGCGIITRRDTGNKYLILTNSAKQVQYYDLTSGSSWTNLATPISKSNRVSIVSLTPNEAYQVGGWTETYGYHVRNWWMWNPGNYRFEDQSTSMRRQHCGGDWTRIPEDAWILKTCSLL